MFEDPLDYELPDKPEFYSRLYHPTRQFWVDVHSPCFNPNKKIKTTEYRTHRFYCYSLKQCLLIVDDKINSICFDNKSFIKVCYWDCTYDRDQSVVWYWFADLKGWKFIAPSLNEACFYAWDFVDGVPIQRPVKTLLKGIFRPIEDFGFMIITIHFDKNLIPVRKENYGFNSISECLNQIEKIKENECDYFRSCIILLNYYNEVVLNWTKSRGHLSDCARWDKLADRLDRVVSGYELLANKKDPLSL